MYEKITGKLRKGYRALKNSSKSFRKHSHIVESTSGKLHQNSRCAASLSGSKNEKFPISDENSTKILEGALSERIEAITKPELTSTEKKWQSVFDNDLYKNWLRVGLALRGTCDAVAPLVDKVLIDFQLDMKSKYPNYEENNNQNELIRDVLRLNRRPISKGQLWKRSNVNKWLVADDGPWEIAKVFLPKGSWSSNHITTARSLDVTGLLNLMMTFAPLANYVSDLQQVHRVIQIRNRTMHNPRLEFTQDEMESCFQAMQNLLYDEQLSSHLAQYQQYEDALEEIAKIRIMNFNLTTAIKSSFEVLEDRLAAENDDGIPSPSAMSSNRELLKSLRQVFGSGEIQFFVDTSAVEEQLEGLENLLSKQQTLAEEKIGLLYRKTNYLQHQLDRLRTAFLTDGTTVAPSYIELNVLTAESSTRAFSKKRKRGKKNKNKNARQWNTQQQRNQAPGRKKCSKMTLNVKKSCSHMRNKSQNKTRPFSVPNLRPKIINSSYLYLTNSEKTFLRPEKDLVHQVMRTMSSSNGSKETDDATTTKSEEGTSSSRNESSCSQKQANGVSDTDVPGPSGLRTTRGDGGRMLRKRRSSTSLIPSNAVKKTLMMPSAPALSKGSDVKGENNPIKGSGKSAESGPPSTTGQSNCSGGGSSGKSYFQEILKSILRQQTKSTPPVFEDKKEGGFFWCTVKFQSKFAVKNLEPQSTAALAETDAAVQALRRLGLQVAEKKNAKPVLNQFCEAAVQTVPNYFSYVVSPRLHLSVVQIHSLFANWGSGLKDKTANDLPLTGIREDVLLQVKTIDSSEYPKDAIEQNCARMALSEANINHSEILNVKGTVNELCLMQGGTLPIYEKRQCSTSEGGPSKWFMTMTSFAREKIEKQDTGSTFNGGLFSDGVESDDIVIATSPQPSCTQDRSEDLAAKSLLEKMGVVAMETTEEGCKMPHGQILRENAVHWGYHLPQYHTFQVKPSINMGQMYFAVVSSKAFHKFSELLSAESEGGMTTLDDARESAARKALLMLGHPQNFYKS